MGWVSNRTEPTSTGSPSQPGVASDPTNLDGCSGLQVLGSTRLFDFFLEEVSDAGVDLLAFGVGHAQPVPFVVHTGCSVDDEHGGWARLFNGVAQSLMQARDEHRAARAATERLADRYQRVLAPRRRHLFRGGGAREGAAGRRLGVAPRWRRRK